MKAKTKQRGRPKTVKTADLASVFVSFRLTGREAKALDDLSARCGMTRSKFVRRAAEDAVVQIERKTRLKAKERTFVDMCRFIIGKD